MFPISQVETSRTQLSTAISCSGHQGIFTLVTSYRLRPVTSASPTSHRLSWVGMDPLNPPSSFSALENCLVLPTWAISHNSSTLLGAAVHHRHMFQSITVSPLCVYMPLAQLGWKCKSPQMNNEEKVRTDNNLNAVGILCNFFCFVC